MPKTLRATGPVVINFKSRRERVGDNPWQLLLLRRRKLQEIRLELEALERELAWDTEALIRDAAAGESC